MAYSSEIRNAPALRAARQKDIFKETSLTGQPLSFSARRTIFEKKSKRPACAHTCTYIFIHTREYSILYLREFLRIHYAHTRTYLYNKYVTRGRSVRCSCLPAKEPAAGAPVGRPRCIMLKGPARRCFSSSRSFGTAGVFGTTRGSCFCAKTPGASYPARTYRSGLHTSITRRRRPHSSHAIKIDDPSAHPETQYYIVLLLL